MKVWFIQRKCDGLYYHDTWTFHKTLMQLFPERKYALCSLRETATLSSFKKENEDVRIDLDNRFRILCAEIDIENAVEENLGEIWNI